MEAKQYVTKQPRDHWRNQSRNQKIPRDKWQWKLDDPEPMGCGKSSSKKEAYSYTRIPKETRKSQINTLTIHLKELEKEEQTKPKFRRRKEIIKSEQK